MSTHSDPHRFRKTVSGIGMVFAPLFLLAAVIVSPQLDSNEGTQLGVIAGDMDRWFVSNLLVIASMVVLLPAILGLMHMLRERETAFGHAGGALALIGVLAVTGGAAISMAMWQMAAAGAERAEMTALLTRMNDTAGVTVPFYFGAFALTVGLIVLAMGLMRAHAVHWTMAMGLAVGSIVLAVGYAVFSVAVLIVGAAFLVVGLVPIGRQVLVESTDEWEHTPEVRGFSPLAGH